MLIALPVILHAAPLADDYVRCIRVEDYGLVGQIIRVFEYRGIVRPFRFVEVSVIGGLCGVTSFAFIIPIGLALTLWVAWQTGALLDELGSVAPWPWLGAALWLLQPLGTEAALWPSAMHVPLGLGLTIVALRRLHAGRTGQGALFGVAACACIEQAIFVLPALAWLVSPSERRRTAVVATAAGSVGILVVYAAWPGQDPRAAVALSDRFLNIGRDLDFYARFPAIGLGAASIPQAVRWGLPWSPLVMVAAAVGGALLGPQLFYPRAPSLWLRGRTLWRVAAVVAGLIVLVNLPSIVTAPRDDSPRIFAPTWLLLIVVGSMLAAHFEWRRPRLAGALAGIFVAAALLSLSLSASVRVRSAELAELALERLAERVPDSSTAVVCNVPPKIVQPAPAGAFALHEFFYDWVAQPALRYHTGRRATIVVGQGNSCPAVQGADVVIDFPDLLTAAGNRNRP